MKLTIEGEIKPYYVQMLAMLWYPGEKFGADCENGRALTVKVGAESVYLSCDTDDGRGELTIKREGETAELEVGRAMYKLFGSLTGFYPEWGTLTGVRPSKLTAVYLAGGMSVSQAAEELERRYLVSPKKAALAAEISAREKAVIDALPEGSCSLYISIPFCPTRCEYCSFVSYATPRLLSMIPDYIARLVSDIKAIARAIKRAGKRVVTVYIGGGTPSILDERQLCALLSAVNGVLPEISDGLLEFTLEAGRPDTITAEKLAAAYAYGVTRVSINPQTTNDSVLKEIGRSHSAEDFFRAYDTAEKSGIKYINCDLIAGLPSDTLQTFHKSVGEVASLSPSNITVHTFAVKKSAEIKERDPDIYSRGGGEVSEAVEYARSCLGDAGYNPYYLYRQKNTAGALENVGYAKEGAEGLYNIFIMEEVHDIFAVGAGAVTKLLKRGADGVPVMQRLFAPKYPYEYLNPEKFDINGLTAKIAEFYG